MRNRVLPSLFFIVFSLSYLPSQWQRGIWRGLATPQEYARLVREGRRGLLPWWFQLVGWVVALAGSVTCSLVINVYGFSYGNKRSKEWLFRTLTGLLHNEIILEPLKVILISAFLARLIPRPPEVDDYSLRNTLTDLPDDLRP